MLAIPAPCTYTWRGRPVRGRLAVSGPTCCQCGERMARGTLVETRNEHGVPHQRHAAGTCDRPDVADMPRKGTAQ